MSEESGYPRVQLSTFITGDQFVFRAESGDQLKEAVESVAAAGDDTIKALNALKQLGVANGIMTGDSQKKGVVPATTAPATSTGGVPNCGCGLPMEDLKEKGYKNRWYASKNCKNKGKDKACWAKPDGS